MLVEKDRISVKFVEIRKSAEGLTRIYFDKILNGSEGKEKLWRGSAVVKSQNLLKRFEKINNGAEIEIEIETDWETEGIPVTLIDFSKVNLSTKESKSAKSNGKMSQKVATGKLALR